MEFSITIVTSGSLARWKCSCGASSGGRWFRSVEEAEKRAKGHTIHDRKT